MATYRTFQIKLNAEKEAARIEWLEGQESYTDAIRVLIDQAIGGNAPLAGGPVMDLAAIRAVIDAALDQHLAGVSLASGNVEAQGEDQELVAKLDALF